MPDPVRTEPPVSIDRLLRALFELSTGHDELPDDSTPYGRISREFLERSWCDARDGLLARTTRLRVRPEAGPSPRAFRFELDLPYLRKRSADAPVERVHGPLQGTIRYRADLFTAPQEEPSVVVFVDREQRLFHPNYSPRFGVLCIGGIPSGPFPLENLLEHVYSILTYENTSTSDPADLEAARYFDQDPDARAGLLPVRPLYGPQDATITGEVPA
jgi:hypothetical protein